MSDLKQFFTYLPSEAEGKASQVGQSPRSGDRRRLDVRPAVGAVGVDRLGADHDHVHYLNLHCGCVCRHSVGWSWVQRLHSYTT
jgi:hypothetical protein